MPDDNLLADRDEVLSLLARAGAGDLQARLDRLSAAILGRPYLADPLVGSAETPERLVSRLDGFDCVTFVESVLALAATHRPEHFAPALQALRYRGGRIDWRERNHYLSWWLTRNHAAGLVEAVLPGLWRVEPEPRRLAAVAGLEAGEERIAYLPLHRIGDLEREARTGDLVCFVSERPDLDVFHAGLLVRGPRLGLRHAARSAGRVVEEELLAFLDRERTAGLMVARLAGSGAGAGA